MPLVGGSSGNPKIVLDAYVDTSGVPAKIAELNQRLDSMTVKLRAQGEAAEQAARRGTMSWTDFRSMYSTVLDVVRVGQQVWEEVGQKFVDNAIAVGNMARALGTTTEEASRLKEVADDVGISVSALTTSFKLAQKDGFQPSIDGLAQMSDEYLALAPGVERTQFLLDRFGRSGEEMGKLLDKGSQAIRENVAAIEKSLLVTEKAYEQARQYQVSVDSLNDSWDAFTYQVAPPLISAATAVLNSIRDSNRASEIATEQGKNYNTITITERNELIRLAAAEREASDANIIAARESENASGAFETEAEAASRLADEAKAAADALAETTKENQGLLSLIGTIQGEMDSYNEKLGEAIEKYGEGSEEVRKLEEAHSQAMAKIAVDLFIAKLAVDGFTDAEYQAALQAQLDAGLIDQATVDMATSWNASATAAANAVSETERLAESINAVPTQHTTTFNLITNGAPPNLNIDPSASAAPKGTHKNAHAMGGTFLVPSSYGSEGFRMGNRDTASGGEMITITPKGESNGSKEIIAAIMAARIDEGKLARLIHEEALKGTR